MWLTDKSIIFIEISVHPMKIYEVNGNQWLSLKDLFPNIEWNQWISSPNHVAHKAVIASSTLPSHSLFFPLDMAAKLMRAVRYSGYGGGAAGLEVLFSPPPEFCFFLVGFPFFLFDLVCLFFFWSFCWFYFYFWVLCDMEAEKRDCEVGLIFFVIESIGFIVGVILFYLFIFVLSFKWFFLPTCFKYKKQRAFDFGFFFLLKQFSVLSVSILYLIFYLDFIGVLFYMWWVWNVYHFFSWWWSVFHCISVWFHLLFHGI